jgi:quercetin dioxygenase-like cupin family protein
MMKLSIIPISLVALMSISHAAENNIERMSHKTMESFSSETLNWKDEPILPKGAKSALLVGDPSKPGVFIVRLKFPANYQIPAHTHPYTEVITVLKGKLGNGMGEKFDVSKGELLKTSDSFVLPDGHSHYVWTTDEEAIVELIATGPWNIKYINPSDDPRIAK